MVAGLIISSTGLDFGSGLQFQTQIGTAGLIINGTTVPGWVPVADGMPADIALDFVGGTAWNGNSTTIPSLLTCSRTGTATYTNAAGVVSDVAANTLRYGSAGLLVEESRTNAITRSEEFNTTWSASGASVTANSSVAPDGATTADKLVPNTSTTQHRVDFTSTFSNVAGAYSVYVKADGYGFAWLRCGSTMSVVVNLSTGATSSVTGTAIVVAAAQGFWRVTLLGTVDTNAVCRINALPSTSTADFAGDGTSGILMWGAQLEAGAFATSYIRTAGAAVTRNADNISFVSTTGQLLSRGTWAWDWLEGPGPISTDHRVFTMRIDGSNQIMARVNTANKADFAVLSTASTTAATLASTNNVVANTAYKGAAAYQVNDYAGRYSSSLGADPAADTSGDPPSGAFSTFVGNATGGAAALNGHIRSLSHWTDTRISNTGLAALVA
jgi:hypothetical protein